MDIGMGMGHGARGMGTCRAAAQGTGLQPEQGASAGLQPGLHGVGAERVGRLAERAQLALRRLSGLGGALELARAPLRRRARLLLERVALLGEVAPLAALRLRERVHAGARGCTRVVHRQNVRGCEGM